MCRGYSAAPCGRTALSSFWNFVTDFGDTAVTLPLAALTIAFLFVSGWRRAAFAFGLALLACAIAIGLAKLALESCGHPLLHTDITNPSGHAAVSTTVYGSLAVLFAGNVAAGRRWIPIAGGAVLLAAIALSRVELDAHSLVEVVLGLAIGLAALALFYRQVAGEPAIAIHGLWLALAGVVVIAIMHGARWPIEDAVRVIVHLIRHNVASCA
ncbi:MAG TPA: phosphatase PAP2 family protein [Candidatus Polarisedimenticolia bacterium]|jgi:membrane-associated phospholipid phosphatase|nr:phosphatase PAP2 family protein [Dongiaceae bacterium]HYV86934.1 phosphatase PAP2 family protein [Candidatus Polarisedimenticolia bacterium]